MRFAGKILHQSKWISLGSACSRMPANCLQGRFLDLNPRWCWWCWEKSERTIIFNHIPQFSAIVIDRPRKTCRIAFSKSFDEYIACVCRLLRTPSILTKGCPKGALETKVKVCPETIYYLGRYQYFVTSSPKLFYRCLPITSHNFTHRTVHQGILVSFSSFGKWFGFQFAILFVTLGLRIDAEESEALILEAAEMLRRYGVLQQIAAWGSPDICHLLRSAGDVCATWYFLGKGLCRRNETMFIKLHCLFCHVWGIWDAWNAEEKETIQSWCRTACPEIPVLMLLLTLKNLQDMVRFSEGVQEYE